jgi:formate hydrogenlyase subunit 6/NADH:ubiquinone oxidoreductase subunit I
MSRVREIFNAVYRIIYGSLVATYAATKYLFLRRPTIEYPTQTIQFTERYRGALEVDDNLCVGCGICAKVCPNTCIFMVPYEKGNPAMIPEIDLQHCMYCGLCVDYCPPGAIYHTHVVKIVGFKRSDLYLSQEKVTNVQELEYK